MLRTLLLIILMGSCPVLSCVQSIDSIHVFQRLADGQWTSASAHAFAWKLHQQNEPFRSVRGADIAVVEEAMALYEPVRHVYGPIPELTHVAMVFSGGRPTVLGVTDDLDRVINVTARKEYRISSISEHMQVRALLARILVE